MAGTHGFERTCPAKLFEYMHLDVPILALISKKSYASELIKKSRTGFFAETSK